MTEFGLLRALPNGVIPRDRIDDRRIEVARGGIGSAADDYLRGVDQAGKAVTSRALMTRE